MYYILNRLLEEILCVLFLRVKFNIYFEIQKQKLITKIVCMMLIVKKCEGLDS